MATLVIEADGQQTQFELSGERVTVGRDPGNDLVIDHADVAARHCVFERADEDSDQYRVVDLGTSIGTQVRSRRVKRWNLMGGDVVRLGAVQVTFHEEPPSTPAPTAAPEVTEAPAATASADEPAPPDAAPPAPEAQTPPPEPTPTAAPPVEPPRAPTRRRADSPEAEDLDILASLGNVRERILKQLNKAIVGQGEVVEQMLLALFCNGHCLLVGLPGLAKTLLVSSLAKIFNLSFRRVQFTPDLMPSDIIGTNVIQENVTTGERSFKFIHGPLFTNILLADEINRTPPKTQAALLEAMQERAVTVGGTTYRLSQPFFVLATQNPIEQEGTYPLPEAQLDRFMFNIIVDYPKRDEEAQIYKVTTGTYSPVLENAVTGEEILRLQHIIRRVPVSDYIINFVTNLVRQTRPEDPTAGEFVKKYVKWGAGPRAGQYLILAAKARAVLNKRLNIDLADIRAAAVPVFRHRIGVNFNAEAEGVSSVDIISQLLRSVQAATAGKA